MVQERVGDFVRDICSLSLGVMRVVVDEDSVAAYVKCPGRDFASPDGAEDVASGLRALVLEFGDSNNANFEMVGDLEGTERSFGGETQAFAHVPRQPIGLRFEPSPQHPDYLSLKRP